MQNFLARCAVLAIIGAGFTATGDVAHVLDRGRRLIEADDVPARPDAEPSAADVAGSTPPTPTPPIQRPLPTPPAAPPAAAPVPAAPTPTTLPATGQSAAATPAEDGRQPFDHRPPANGPERIEVAALRAGDRLTIWLRPTATGAPLRLMCDVIDPAAGEVLVTGGPTGASVRGVLRSATGGPAASLVRGATIQVQRLGPGGGPAMTPLASGAIAALATGG
ncbi:MAG: hypothetical protein ACK5SI_01840 [Planctomycetia bacterium]|jgi:hypothetical protein